MADIPQEIIDQFFTDQGVKNVVMDNYGFGSEISPTGDFKKYNGKELAVYRVTVLLSVSEGSYINDPDYGVKIDLYQKMTKANIDNMKDNISKKISKYEKDLSLVSIKDTMSEKNKSVKLTLNLKYNPTGENVVLSFGFIRDMQALIRLAN